MSDPGHHGRPLRAASLEAQGRLCTARSKRTGEQCLQPAIAGAPVCRHHGGRAPQVAAKAERRLKMQRTMAQVSALIQTWEAEDSVDTNPMSTLIRMVHMSALTERAYAAILAEDEDGLILETRGPQGSVNLDTNPLVKLWNDERDRAAKVSKLALDAGVDEKRIRLEEQQADELVKVIVTVLRSPDLGLTEDQVQAALGNVAVQARRLAS